MPEYVTHSVCPVCLERLAAAYEEGPNGVDMVKTCPQHGTFRVPIWRGGPVFSSWRRPKTPSFPRLPGSEVGRGCPFDCGLCPEHEQHTCTGVIEVTARCDLGCPVCYAKSGEGQGFDPDLPAIARMLDSLWKASGACNVQLSGGEPTVREDLPDIVRMARNRGFPFVQLNSNGLRLGREPDLARVLADAGLDSVYLQFDGADDDVYTVLRGKPCFAEKVAAVRHCAEAGLGVVLVATLARGVNLHKLGGLLHVALELGPAVRGLHVQPVASFGRFPWELEQAPRVTLPEVMAELAGQSQGMLSVADFHPPGCEHALCSFSAVYRRTPEGGLVLLPGGHSCCDTAHGTHDENAGAHFPDASMHAVMPLSPPAPGAVPRVAEEGARAAKAFTARHWSAAPVEELPSLHAPLADDFDRFLARAGLAHRFTLSCMAFQDVMTLDVERVRGCCIHVVNPEGRLIPFCLYNLTSLDGRPLYRDADFPHA